MATRKEIYSMLEGIEGAEKAKDALKELFTADDEKLQAEVDRNKALKNEFSTLETSFNELKEKSADTVPKTEMEKQILAMQKTLDGITEERDNIKAENEKAIIEKKNNELSSFFSKAVIDSFGAKNAEMSVGYAMANGSLKYGDDNSMMFKDKTGDDAIELFKTENAHLVQNKGTGTSGGNNNGGNSNAFIDELREQMLRD